MLAPLKDRSVIEGGGEESLSPTLLCDAQLEMEYVRQALRDSRQRLRQGAWQSTRQIALLNAEVARLQARCKIYEQQLEHYSSGVAVIELGQALMRLLPRGTSEFVLHTTAVGNCEERTPLAELLHKTLEKRYSLILKRLSAIKTNTDLRLAWQQACQEATQIPGNLWAVWTHPACDAKLEQDVYGDIHMIQHQIGTGTRADVRQLHALESDKSRLEGELSRLRAEIEVLRQGKVDTVQTLKQQLVDLRGELVAKDAWSQGLHNELLALRSAMPDLDCRQELARQREEVWQQNIRLMSELAERDKELIRLREFAQYAEETLESLAREDEAQSALPVTDLSGKCVLCVGGRAGAVTSYREVVEQSGGRFLHHDGGLEESLRRIDGAITAADIVICQAGCISHNAYWRVKDLCKRTGKTCMFVKASGVSSFERVVNHVGKQQQL